MGIKLGPAGIGPVKDIEETFRKYKEAGIEAAEIPFTYGVYIKKDEDIKKVRNASKKFYIRLSIHAPYWVNLNSKEKKKIEKSNCCCLFANIKIRISSVIITRPVISQGINADFFIPYIYIFNKILCNSIKICD